MAATPDQEATPAGPVGHRRDDPRPAGEGLTAPTGATETPPPSTGFAVGQVLGDRYEIRSLLGHGGMGTVWQATDLKLRVEVALKSLRPEFTKSEKRRELLRAEVRTAREVISPNVCRVYDLVVEDGHELLSMEYIDGTTLLHLLKERAPLDIREAGELAAQFLAGLDAVHEAGLVHRDFKPENVMITRAGRVVVMDFGIAKAAAASEGTIAGTPAYMAPEQLSGDAVDARTDVFAAGVVLAEMISEAGIEDRKTREDVWKGVRESPPRLPAGPWEPVLRKAVAVDPRDRYPTARALVRALEEVTLRVEGTDETSPYPGLAAFTEEDADHFFGRESEIETLFGRLGRPRLLALTGPSGAGKSSLLGAGLIPALPEGWGHIRCAPGDRPFPAVARALVPELAGDPEALAKSADFDDVDVAVSLLKTWRQKHSQAILILDQFEELFTLNTHEEQERFAELLGRLPIEANVHVLVSMRDDFLFRCHEFPALVPVISELTMVGPPQGAALRRALVQPALVSGYRFEDDALVDDMIDEIRDERGALPLLAFAASRLWEKRDSDAGLLTRRAYQEIGGVGGALARHAEATLESIGMAREPLVRELFRNLVTSQGTRALRDRTELLSVFEDSGAAGDVLQRLVDARLLTTFEVRDVGDDESSQRIEIIHESLLSEWPRLVRWRTQDADGAQLRDQLRQVAKVWEERGQPSDLLWTGPSYKEFEAWRERYAGGLSSTEEAFVGAMVDRAGQQRRRRTLAVVTAFGLLVAVLGLVSSFWATARRAETLEKARRLVSLARLKLEEDRTAAVAYAIRSLEVTDTPQARELVVEALGSGPIARVAPVDLPGNDMGDFSSDARYYVTAASTIDAGRAVRLLRRDGGLAEVPTEGQHPSFLGENLLLVARIAPEPIVEQWRVSDMTRLDDLPLWTLRTPGKLFHLRRDDDGWAGGVWSPGPDGAVFEPLDELATLRPDFEPYDTATGDWYLERRDRSFYLGTMHDWNRKPRPLTEELFFRAFSPNGRFLATADGEAMNVWSTDDSRRSNPRVLAIDRNGALNSFAAFQPNGSLLAAMFPGALEIWDLDRPEAFGPAHVLRGAPSFDPAGQWLAAGRGRRVDFYPLNGRYPAVAEIEDMNQNILGSARGGYWLAYEGSDRVLLATRTHLRRIHLRGLESGIETMDPFETFGAAVALRPNADELFVWRRDQAGPGPPRTETEMAPGPAFLLDLESGERREIPSAEFHWALFRGAFSPDGEWVAMADQFTVGSGWGTDKSVRLLNVNTGEWRRLGPVPAGEGADANFASHCFLPGGDLVTLEGNGLRRWNIGEGSHRLVREGRWTGSGRIVCVPEQDRIVLLTTGTDEGSALEVLNLEDGTSRSVHTHGNEVTAIAVDPAGSILVTGGRDNLIRVGPLHGGEPHILYGHEDRIGRLAVSPDGTEIASTSMDSTLRLWPMPSGTPRHLLPLDELLARLKNLTNVRIVEDPSTPDGYRIAYDSFPGWEDVPQW